MFETKPQLIVKGIVVGSLIGILGILLLICISALLFLNLGSLPGDAISYIVIAFNAIAAFFAGYIAARIIKQNGMLWGLCTGLTMLAIIAVGGLITSGDNVSMLILYKAAALVLFSVIGGIKGVNHKEKIKIK